MTGNGECDELDSRILRELQENSRQSARALAEKLGVAVGTVQNRIQKLEQNKIITGYHCHLDYGKLGYNVVAIIGIKARREKLAELEKALESKKEVYALMEVTGTFDIMIAVIFKSISGLNKFIKDLPADSIKETQTFLVLKSLKEGHYRV